MEIDPHKVEDASDTTINSLELWLVAQKLFKCIVSSEKQIPLQIKQLLRHINSEVGVKFDDHAQFRALGGFFFLRIISPAIMAPQAYGLLDAPAHPVCTLSTRRSRTCSLTQQGDIVSVRTLLTTGGPAAIRLGC